MPTHFIVYQYLHGRGILVAACVYWGIYKLLFYKYYFIQSVNSYACVYWGIYKLLFYKYYFIQSVNNSNKSEFNFGWK